MVYLVLFSNLFPITIYFRYFHPIYSFEAKLGQNMQLIRQ